MVKNFRKIEREEILPNEEEQLSDLEIDDHEKVLEEEINDVDTLETITGRIKDDFYKLMKSR